MESVLSWTQSNTFYWETWRILIMALALRYCWRIVPYHHMVLYLYVPKQPHVCMRVLLYGAHFHSLHTVAISFRFLNVRSVRVLRWNCLGFSVQRIVLVSSCETLGFMCYTYDWHWINSFIWVVRVVWDMNENISKWNLHCPGLKIFEAAYCVAPQNKRKHRRYFYIKGRNLYIPIRDVYVFVYIEGLRVSQSYENICKFIHKIGKFILCVMCVHACVLLGHIIWHLLPANAEDQKKN